MAAIKSNFQCSGSYTRCRCTHHRSSQQFLENFEKVQNFSQSSWALAFASRSKAQLFLSNAECYRKCSLVTSCSTTSPTITPASYISEKFRATNFDPVNDNLPQVIVQLQPLQLMHLRRHPILANCPINVIIECMTAIQQARLSSSIRVPVVLFQHLNVLQSIIDILQFNYIFHYV